MSRFVTYCDLEFLDGYYRQKPPADKDASDFGERDQLWLDVHRFLRRRTDVVVGLPGDDMNALVDRYPFLRYYLSRPAGSTSSFDAEALADVEKESFHENDENPWRLFFLDQTEKAPEELSALYGALFLNAEQVLDTWERIERNVTLSVSQNPAGDNSLQRWEDLQQFRMPLTGLLICDQYMLGGLQQARENIFAMVAQLLPDAGNTMPVSIMLVTKELDRQPSVEAIYEGLWDYLIEHRPGLQFVLTIVVARRWRDKRYLQKYHDRHAFANYSFLKSGRSFDYFSDSKVKHETTLDIHPMVDPGIRAVALDRLKAIQELVDEIPKEYGKQQCVWGPREHPLLRAVRPDAGAASG